MDFKAVLHALGALLIFIAAALLIPTAVAFFFDEGDFLPFVYALLTTFGSGFIFWKFTPVEHEIKTREGFAVVTIAWILLAAFGALPFVFAIDISFTDAFFETMSGFTTTGGTILSDVEALPHGLLFWRSFTHWLGGMGIILLSLAILPMLGVGGMQLFKAEVPGPSVDKIRPRVQDTAKILWGVYVLLSLIETILLKLGGMNWFDAICHTFGTMATGGFSTKNAGIMHFDSVYLQYVIAVFMILAGINFALHYRFLRRQFTAYQKNEEFRAYLGIILTVTLFLSFSTLARDYESYADSFRHGLFQVASLLTTTGFHSADYECLLVAVPAQLVAE